jgi:crossover junction endodeoxyribonuclease RuvC
VPADATPMTVLGVDPGTAITGYGFVRETGSGLAAVAFGAIRTPPGEPMAARLQTIYRELRRLVAEHQPVSAGVEQLFFSKNVTTALAVGQARGVVLLALADSGLAVAEYRPVEIKQAVSGYGGAAKRQVQEMVRLLLELPAVPQPDDAADALAIAICHLYGQRFSALLAEQQ